MAYIYEKYILYGASFNPPHIGHRSAISQMLEEYDRVVVFPYPKSYSPTKDKDNKYYNYDADKLPAISQRMKMLEMFFAEYFPKMYDRLILTDLASEMIKNKITKGHPHTYDYLLYSAKEKIPPGSEISVCLGFDTKHTERQENYHNSEEMQNNFKVFRLEEENTIKSEDLRKFFSSHKNLKSAKDELYIRYAVGNSLAEYIFKNNLYGVKKKEIATEKELIIPTEKKIITPVEKEIIVPEVIKSKRKKI